MDIFAATRVSVIDRQSKLPTYPPEMEIWARELPDEVLRAKVRDALLLRADPPAPPSEPAPRWRRLRAFIRRKPAHEDSESARETAELVAELGWRRALGHLAYRELERRGVIRFRDGDGWQPWTYCIIQPPPGHTDNEAARSLLTRAALRIAGVRVVYGITDQYFPFGDGTPGCPDPHGYGRRDLDDAAEFACRVDRH